MIEVVRDVINDWTARIPQCKEFTAWKNASAELERVQKSLNDEVAVIVLRGVVQGRCRYCPV